MALEAEGGVAQPQPLSAQRPGEWGEGPPRAREGAPGRHRGGTSSPRTGRESLRVIPASVWGRWFGGCRALTRSQ